MQPNAIAKLGAAKDLDQQISNDPYADPAEGFDALMQRQKADHIVRKLQLGLPVSKRDLHDPSEVPPFAISEEQKRSLARPLKQDELQRANAAATARVCKASQKDQ